MSEPRYVLVLAPITGSRWAAVPPAVRLRRLLKAAARSFGLRVVEVRREDSESERNGGRAA